jgi:hypothetical protein
MLLSLVNPGDAVRKTLPIPVFVDDYNHNMGDVDLANQLKNSDSVEIRPHKDRSGRAAMTSQGCKQCNVALCLKGNCWDRFHTSD